MIHLIFPNVPCFGRHSETSSGAGGYWIGCVLGGPQIPPFWGTPVGEKKKEIWRDQKAEESAKIPMTAGSDNNSFCWIISWFFRMEERTKTYKNRVEVIRRCRKNITNDHRKSARFEGHACTPDMIVFFLVSFSLGFMPCRRTWVCPTAVRHVDGPASLQAFEVKDSEEFEHLNPTR